MEDELAWLLYLDDEGDAVGDELASLQQFLGGDQEATCTLGLAPPPPPKQKRFSSYGDKLIFPPSHDAK